MDSGPSGQGAGQSQGGVDGAGGPAVDPLTLRHADPWEGITTLALLEIAAGLRRLKELLEEQEKKAA